MLLKNNKIIEGFDSNVIDFSALQNLGIIAEALNSNGTLTFPGNLIIKGSLTTNGNLTVDNLTTCKQMKVTDKIDSKIYENLGSSISTCDYGGKWKICNSQDDGVWIPIHGQNGDTINTERNKMGPRDLNQGAGGWHIELRHRKSTLNT